jgi:hypothetical protein
MAGVPSGSLASLGSIISLPPVPGPPPAIADRAGRLEAVGAGRAHPSG